MERRRSQLRMGQRLKIMQQQVGHAYGSTTAIYMGVSNEYRNKLLEAALKDRLSEDWDVTPAGDAGLTGVML